MKFTARWLLFPSSLLLSMMQAKDGAASDSLVPAIADQAPHVILGDKRVSVTFGERRLVLAGGLQPSLLATGTGTLVVQAQGVEKPFAAKRISYPSAIGTVISRDEGKTWSRIPLKPGENGLNMEGGAVQLRDGTIVALDTYVTPAEKPGHGLGERYISRDDWRTLEGPEEITFTLPGVRFHGSSDDYGRTHEAVRLHRRILELPNGDLLATLYGWFEGDTTPAAYRATMHRTRAVLLRSKDRGKSWSMVSTIAAGADVGTEGYGEPALVRIGTGEHAGRLICQMRTGYELREAISDDDGQTWSAARPRTFAGRDVRARQNWIGMFGEMRNQQGERLADRPDELIASIVDPDLLELRSGVLVAAFGMRVPARNCWTRWEHPWNGNYLAFSLDHGETWSHVIQLTSGVLTTHYMAIEELPGTNRFFVAYDLGAWGSAQGRSVFGRTVELTTSMP
ncbi:glycoside hydrolase [Horticoccus luteus]|uniref:Glycoside hydrolase n=1 Tax=Horticoccus luteus TaxID=2862869 RepID=A0A8F9TU91_9BACT|nr:sialidase family protein [Horticoccus luteus]QYM79379.1 glycoside hydrolase [Horticoccus luteus]